MYVEKYTLIHLTLSGIQKAALSLINALMEIIFLGFTNVWIWPP